MSAQWNITLNDTSPVFSYLPYYDGFGLTNGWQIWYSESGFNTEFAYPGNGYSAHITSLPGANVTLQFYGTGIELVGTANCSYDITLDNVLSGSLSPAGDVLFSKAGLSEGSHSVTLTAQPDQSNQQLAFEQAIISTTLSDNQQAPQTISYDNTNTTFLNYAGNWSVGTDSHIPGETYHYTVTIGSSVSMLFSGSAAVVVQGIVNWGNWEYTVSLNDTQYVLNASSYWFVPDTTLFYQGGLDPGQTYALNITDSSEDGDKLAMNSVVIYQSLTASNPLTSTAPLTSTIPSTSTTPSTSTKHTNAGVIAGPVIGVVVVVAAVAAFFFWRSRTSRRAKNVHNRRNFDILGAHTTPTEYVEPFSPFSQPRSIASGSEKFVLSPLRGYADTPSSPQSSEAVPAPESVISSTAMSSGQGSASAVSSPPLAASTRRPLPPQPGSISPSSQINPEQQEAEDSPHLPDSEVNRILQMLAARIDRPDDANSSMPPPQYRG